VCGGVPHFKEQVFQHNVEAKLPEKKPAEAGFAVGRKSDQL
jgi:hypothetical protein